MEQATSDELLARARERYLASKGARKAEDTRENALMAKVHQSALDRQELLMQGFAVAPMPTGVKYQSPKTGRVQDIMDDGSLRNLWGRAPGVSGRQFRKMRKVAQRAARAEQQRALKPVYDLLPAIAGHRHAIGENLAPTCGCAYTQEALEKLRELVKGPNALQE